MHTCMQTTINRKEWTNYTSGETNHIFFEPQRSMKFKKDIDRRSKTTISRKKYSYTNNERHINATNAKSVRWLADHSSDRSCFLFPSNCFPPRTEVDCDEREDRRSSSCMIRLWPLEGAEDRMETKPGCHLSLFPTQVWPSPWSYEVYSGPYWEEEDRRSIIGQCSRSSSACQT